MSVLNGKGTSSVRQVTIEPAFCTRAPPYRAGAGTRHRGIRLPVLCLLRIQMMNGSKSVRDTKGIFLLRSGVTGASNRHGGIVSPRAMLSHGSITSSGLGGIKSSPEPINQVASAERIQPRAEYSLGLIQKGSEPTFEALSNLARASPCQTSEK